MASRRLEAPGIAQPADKIVVRGLALHVALAKDCGDVNDSVSVDSIDAALVLQSTHSIRYTGPAMFSTTPDVDTKEFERRTGWLIRPEGACKEGRCVPLGGPVSETVDLRVIAQRLSIPLVHDEAGGVWCLGPEAGGKALTSARAPDLTLGDWRGERFQLSSLLGQKVLLVAWASW